MSYDKASPAPMAPPQLGIDWVNIITGHDHTTGNADGPYFCEIHLQINLRSEEVFTRLNRILTEYAEKGAALDAKLDQVRALLKEELVHAGRNNESTVAIVEAIRLR